MLEDGVQSTVNTLACLEIQAVAVAPGPTHLARQPNIYVLVLDSVPLGCV